MLQGRTTLAGTAARPSLPAAAVDRAWELVRRWPRLRGEAKLAWQMGWSLSRGGLQQIVLSPGEVGLDQGTSDDAGRRQLMALCAEGLVRIVDRGKRGASDYTGRWLLEWADPLDVARGKPVDWDGQQYLPFAEDSHGRPAVAEYPHGRPAVAEASEEGTPGACSAGTSSGSDDDARPAGRGEESADCDTSPHSPSVWRPPTVDRGSAQSGSAVPRRPPTSVTSEVAGAIKTSNFGAYLTSAHTSESVHPGERAAPKAENDRRGSAPASAAGVAAARPTACGSAGPGTLADVLAALPAAVRDGLTPVGQQAWIEDLARYLHARVNCPQLRWSPCVTAAEAAVQHPEGLKIAGELTRILLKIDQARAAGAIRRTPSAMFNDLLTRARARFCF